MALANIACLLAKNKVSGKGVLMIDWDLEAPGLHRYFNRGIQSYTGDLLTDDEFDDHPGLLDIFIHLNDVTKDNIYEDDFSRESATLSLVKDIKLEHFILRTHVPNLLFMKAGVFDAGYSLRVNTFEWERFYNRLPELIQLLAERLAEEYDYVLIDSRTGVSDVSGICTTLMPDNLVAVFTPNRQSFLGVLDVIRQATDYRKQSEDLRPLMVFPLPARIEPAEPNLRSEWRFGSKRKNLRGYQPHFEDLLQEIYDLPQCDLTQYFDDIQIQHIPRYAYGEEIAVQLERSTDRLSLAQSYDKFTDQLVTSQTPWSIHLPPRDTGSNETSSGFKNILAIFHNRSFYIWAMVFLIAIVGLTYLNFLNNLYEWQLPVLSSILTSMVLYCVVPVIYVILGLFIYLLVLRSPNLAMRIRNLGGVVGGILAALLMIILDVTTPIISGPIDTSNITSYVVVGILVGFLLLYLTDLLLQRMTISFIVLFWVWGLTISAYFT